ncbi:MAG: hypothetical protein NTW96_27630 [Planctomycetia bacterium]|nr:hypothetical protein [Planctomycetia bacterium]
MNEYRCVIPSLYPGDTEYQSMQGHYIRAETEAGAREKFQAQTPGERVHVRLWKENVDAVGPLPSWGVFIGRIEAILNAYRAEHITSVDAIDAVQSALVKLKNRG